MHSEAVASFLAHYWPPVLISLGFRPGGKRRIGSRLVLTRTAGIDRLQRRQLLANSARRIVVDKFMEHQKRRGTAHTACTPSV